VELITMPADHYQANWRKSSYSNGNGGTCVEMAYVDRVVAIRDSKNPAGPTLVFASEAFSAWIKQTGDRES
jgi:hypothetical protein